MLQIIKKKGNLKLRIKKEQMGEIKASIHRKATLEKEPTEKDSRPTPPPSPTLRNTNKLLLTIWFERGV